MNTRLLWYCYGNQLPETTLVLARKCEELITGARAGAKTLQREALPQQRFFKVPKKKNLIFERVLKNTENFTQKNSGITKSYSIGRWTPKLRILTEILDAILGNDFFHQLRTIEQLGYGCWSFPEIENRLIRFSFAIKSDCKPAHYLGDRIDSFLQQEKLKLDEMTDEKFNEFKSGVMTELTKKYVEFSDKSNLMWKHIKNHDYVFNFKEEISQRVLSTVSKADILEFYYQVFLDPKTVRTYEIHITPE